MKIKKDSRKILFLLFVELWRQLKLLFFVHESFETKGKFVLVSLWLLFFLQRYFHVWITNFLADEWLRNKNFPSREIKNEIQFIRVHEASAGLQFKSTFFNKLSFLKVATTMNDWAKNEKFNNLGLLEELRKAKKNGKRFPGIFLKRSIYSWRIRERSWIGVHWLKALKKVQFWREKPKNLSFLFKLTEFDDSTRINWKLFKGSNFDKLWAEAESLKRNELPSFEFSHFWQLR